MGGLSPSPSTKNSQVGLLVVPSSDWGGVLQITPLCSTQTLRHWLCLELYVWKWCTYEKINTVGSHVSGLCPSLQNCPPNLDSPLKRINPRIRPFLVPVKQQKRTTKSQPPNKPESTKTKHHCFYIMEPCSFIAWQNILLSRISVHSSLDK